MDWLYTAALHALFEGVFIGVPLGVVIVLMG